MSIDAMDAASVAPVTTMASAMFFGTIIFATAALATRGSIMGDQKMFDTAANPRSNALDIKSLPSVYTLLFHSSIMGLILMYAYICEYHPPFPHADKNYDADLFFFLTFLLFVIAFFTWKRHVPHAVDTKKANGADSPTNGHSNGNGQRQVAEAHDDTEILNRDQTEEWKGWMQFMFLLYHYYHAEEVYNAIRIMITCYVWMTGFGNFSFFYLKSDFGVVRVLQMLWRLNFLVLFLCLTQGTTYILYYICLLHTYYFFMVYVVMRIGYEKNHTKWWVRIKLAVLAIIIFLVWDCDLGLFKLIHYPFFGEHSKQGATAGSMWEWYFRSSLDHWSTYLGMIFALNFPITSLFFRKLEAQPLFIHVLAKGIVGIALFGAFMAWVTGPFLQEKFDYNQTNAYYGFVPLIAYIYFRNLTPWLRNHTLDLLHQIGKTTLETYLMQHHIWLTSDAKSLLTLVPGWPKVNFLLVSLIYVLLSRRLYTLTLFLRGMVLPDNKQACFKNLFGMAGFITFFVVLAFLLDSQDVMTLQVCAAVSFLCGLFLYKFVVNATTVQNGLTEKSIPKHYPQPYLSGALVILALGLFWQNMAIKGASKILPLPAHCAQYANDGQWLTLTACDEGPRGQEYRKYGISPDSTCSTQNSVPVWGWHSPGSSTHCRFKQRDAKSLKTHLKGRTIVFIGDSVTRYVYYSFCRQLGLEHAGDYNAHEVKHEDKEQKIGDITIKFKWTGFASELKESFVNMTKPGLNPKTDKVPDLFILGGGAWDKLWRYNTEEEKKALQQTYEQLAAHIEKTKQENIPVVWLTPTTINTAALPSEEKEKNINEDEIETLRVLHKTHGVVSSASFVIDGPAFTKSRVTESFDGVHYPHHVYSAGAQILANSLDWLLPEPLTEEKKPPQPGAMAHVPLGLMMVVIAFLGIFTFDGFVGFSYLAAICVPSVAPYKLFYEAFSDLHRRKKLPPLECSKGESLSLSSRDNSEHREFDEEETAGLMNKSS